MARHQAESWPGITPESWTGIGGMRKILDGENYNKALENSLGADLEFLRKTRDAGMEAYNDGLTPGLKSLLKKPPKCP